MNCTTFVSQICLPCPTSAVRGPTPLARSHLTSRRTRWHSRGPLSSPLLNLIGLNTQHTGPLYQISCSIFSPEASHHEQRIRPVSEPLPDTENDPEMKTIGNMKALARHRQWEELHHEYESFVRLHGPTERLLTVYVRLQGRAGRISQARDAILSSPSADCGPARTAFVTAIARHRPATQAFTELLATPSPLWSPHVCTAVLHAIGLAGRSDLVHTILAQASNRGVIFDVTMFDAALRSLGRGGKLDEAYQLLNQMTNFGIQPTSNTMEALIYACAHVQDNYKNMLYVQSIGLRACVIYEAAIQKNLISPPVLSAFASVVLRSRLWNDHRVTSLIQNMRHALKLGTERLRRLGVSKDKFQAKLERILYLRSETSDT